MIKMLLADDEPVITKGIQALINWERLGVQITGVYENGRDALKAILSAKPGVAVLDISMPDKSGLEILKELSKANASTKVIFLSGFSEFEYAQTAIRYGAVDYLLKPVNKDALITAVKKCIAQSAGKPDEALEAKAPANGFLPAEIRKKLENMKSPYWALCLAEPLALGGKKDMEKRLSLFSLLNRLKEYLEHRKAGEAFQREGRIWLVLAGYYAENQREFFTELTADILSEGEAGFVFGEKTPDIEQLKDKAAELIEAAGSFYYLDYLRAAIIKTGGSLAGPELETISQDETRDIRRKVVAAMSEQEEAFGALVNQYTRAARLISAGKRDVSDYYLLSCLHAAEERFETLGLGPLESVIMDTMGKFRTTERYSQAEEIFTEIMARFYTKMTRAIKTSKNKDILAAKNYIEEHYAENLTLETLANVVHMNPFYFSAFFKKQAGENFKDYLNSVRIKRCRELLALSDKRVYEIAEEAGFSDYRYFTEVFRKHYGKTPTAYRKELIGIELE
jgi:two-component system response regulator YesN